MRRSLKPLWPRYGITVADHLKEASRCTAERFLKVFLRALVSIDPYAFDDVAEQLAANDENNQQTSEEILLSTIDGQHERKESQ